MKVGSIGALAVFVVACTGSDVDARNLLEADGFTDIELTKSEGVFEFKAKKGTDVCTGTLTIKKSLGGANHFQQNACKRDTSACKPGAKAACLAIADELYAREAKVFPTDAAELYRIACADSDGRACARASEFEAIGKAWDKVREYAQKGCDFGNGDACVRLAYLDFEAKGVAKDVDKALTGFKKGCDAGAMRGCRAAAGVLLDKEPTEATAALPLARKACEAKYEDACFVLGAASFQAKTDYPIALGHLEAACNDDAFAKRGIACNLAGAILFDGLGMPRDHVKGHAAFERACIAGDANGCSNAARALRIGIGVPRDPAKATELQAKACQLGMKSECKASGG
jgi:TPR repeat protein